MPKRMLQIDCDSRREVWCEYPVKNIIQKINYNEIEINEELLMKFNVVWCRTKMHTYHHPKTLHKTCCVKSMNQQE